MKQISSHPLYRVYTIDSAMNSLWDFYRKRFLPLFLISLLMSLIIQYASTMIDFSEMQSITDPEEMLSKLREYIWPMVLISILNLLFYTVLQYYIIYNPLDKYNNAGRCALLSLRYFIPYLIIMVFLVFFGSFAILLGLIALVIGVFFSILYILTIYLFILPVMMSEGPSIANTISRSVKLAHRNFWANMGWTAALILIVLIVTVVLSGLVLLPFTGSFLKVFSNPDDSAAILDLAGNPFYIFLTSAVNALVFPLLPVFGVILYFNGCAREDQTSVQDFNREERPDDRIKVEDLYARPLPEDNSEETIDHNEPSKQ